jgi:hypothetical protein
VEIQRRPQRVLVGLPAAVSFLLVADLLGLVSSQDLAPDAALRKLIPIFDFRQEYNVPTLYVALAILMCSGLLGFIGASTRAADRAESNHWLGLAGVFFTSPVTSPRCASADSRVGLLGAPRQPRGHPPCHNTVWKHRRAGVP